MDSILGLIMIYTWVHSVVIISKLVIKQVKTTTYENVVLIAGAVGFFLIVLGIITNY